MTHRNLALLVACAVGMAGVTTQSYSQSVLANPDQPATTQQFGGSTSGNQFGDSAVGGQNSASAAGNQSSGSQKGVGWFAIEETISMLLDDEPDDSMKDCKEAFKEKNFSEASEELGDIASFMSKAAASANGDARSKLQKSASELKKLATKVKSGNLNSPKALDDAFARAQHSLASDYMQKGKQALGSNNMAKIGDALKKTVNQIKEGTNWTDQDLSNTATNTISSAKQLAGKLAQGNKVSSDDINKAFSGLSNVIQQMGQSIPKQSTGNQPAAN